MPVPALLSVAVVMVEASIQPLLQEIAERRELLHQAYILCHRAIRARDTSRSSPSATADADQLEAVSMEAVSAWVRSESSGMPLPSTNANAASATSGLGGSGSAVDDAMEAVLEDTLRLNRRLEAQLHERKEKAQVFKAID